MALRRFTQLQDSPTVAALIHKLRAAGIEADVTREQDMVTIYTGGALCATVWIDEAADQALAASILNDVLQQRPRNLCPVCGYDLRGHEGESVCPECGERVWAREKAFVCAACGELSPGNFEVCWNCGGALTESVDAEQVPRRSVDHEGAELDATTDVRLTKWVFAAVVVLLILLGVIAT